MKIVIALVFIFGLAYCVEEEFFAPTEAPVHDIRNEYDRLLIEVQVEKQRQIEMLLLRLTRQTQELEKTKDKDLKARIISEIEEALPLMQASETYLQRELKRTDLDLVERFIFETSADNVALLIKQLTALETKVKAM